MVGWPLLADLSTTKLAGVPIQRSLNNQLRLVFRWNRLKQQALTQYETTRFYFANLRFLALDCSIVGRHRKDERRVAWLYIWFTKASVFASNSVVFGKILRNCCWLFDKIPNLFRLELPNSVAPESIDVELC
jgi:hypothetical protein